MAHYVEGEGDRFKTVFPDRHISKSYNNLFRSKVWYCHHVKQKVIKKGLETIYIHPCAVDYIRKRGIP